jgi:hypothetical protein
MKNNLQNNIVRSARLALLFIFSACMLTGCKDKPSPAAADLEKGFLNPPESARPRVWWHWMNGNITKEGIRADLTWMKRVKLGGFQNFDAALSTPQVVAKRLVYMTPEWKDAFHFTAALADSLGLEMAIAGSPGWSESGGSWVTPAQAMKKYVWSETEVEGGKPFAGILPKPPSVTGTFQDIEDRKDENPSPSPQYYKDALVVAYQVPANEITIKSLKPKITSSGGKFDLAQLSDGNLVKSTFLPAAPANGSSWIQYEFSKPETIRTLTMVAEDEGNEKDRMLEVSDDGIKFNEAVSLKKGESPQTTIAFAPVLAKFFRITFSTPKPEPGSTEQENRKSVPHEGTNIAELALGVSPMVNHFEDKAGFDVSEDLYSLSTQPVPEAESIKKDAIVDLTSKMQPNGKLEWTPPAGRWMILRLGYSLTGKKNHPASPEATGFEVDKLSAEHVKAYFSNYLDQYKDATQGLMGAKGLKYVITDSWEAGTLNWTDNMPAEFKKRRGYDMLPWLPVLSGHIVESAEASDRFLWDFRKTIGDLTVENHYDQLTTLLRERGMGRYTESHEGWRAMVADGMEIKRSADIPMSATWTPSVVGSNDINNVHKADVRESASVAHIYGQNLVAAESMTAIGTPWAWSPEYLKPTADMELCSGLNRFVIHCSVHQPVFDKIPGLGLGPFGQWFTRNETWAEQAVAWTTYLSRSSFMLQQGKFVADIAYYYGEDNNITMLFEKKLPPIPSGYNYDFVNSDALTNLLTVEQGNIVTPGGMSYRILVLDPNSRYMTLPVLRKLSSMVKAGAIVAGNKPVGTPSLSDDQADFKTLADELWPKEKGESIIGKGKTITGLPVGEVLNSLKIVPDFEFNAKEKDTDLLYVHRKVADIDLYWVNNRHNRPEETELTFRVSGRAAEIWHPETGKIEKATYSIKDGKTKVHVRLEPNDAVFVVFSSKTGKSSFTVEKQVESELAKIEGPWNLSFQPGLGAPASATLDQLSSWSENSDQGIKYFSGTGTYSKTIQVPDSWLKSGAEVWLDLGSVKNLAEVILNGKSLGIIWKTPFRVNLTEALKQGDNQLEIKVTDLWVNRLIGDEQPGTKTKISYATQAFYKADSPLIPSGLLGPVKVLGIKN